MKVEGLIFIGTLIFKETSLKKLSTLGILQIKKVLEKKTTKKLAFCRSSRPEVCRSEDYNFIEKETLAQVFSCECCEIFKNTFFL